MIHKTAIIDPKARISSNVVIGAYSVIGPNVEIDENTIIYPHVSISGHTKIGKRNKIYPFASIGNDPQDLKYKGEETKLIIGDQNSIREYVSINPGTVGGESETKIGNNCLLMVSSHVAHDCIVEDKAVQQFTRIGKGAMIGGMTGVLHDVIPYALSTGNRNSLQGLNLIGLRRAKFDNKVILGLGEAYKEIFATTNLTKNLSKLNDSFHDNPLVKDVIKFITKDKKRSICTPFS